MSNGKYLVTGATGFTGGAVTDLLLARGKEVRVLIRDQSKAQQFLRRGIEVVIGDLNDESAIEKAVDGISCILHIGALFRQAGLPESEFHRVNVEGTRLLIEKASSAKVPKMVHCSTVGVLGHIQSPPANEATPYNPGDPYQRSKMEGEKLFLEAVAEGKLQGCVIRPAMIYGPGDTRTLKIFGPIAKRRFFYVGRGDALVHFIDVRDLAESFLLAAENTNANGEIFIIAGETSLPLRELSGIIANIMGVTEPWIRLPVKPMQLLGSLCEAICTPLRINPPIFRRRVDFFTKDRCFDITKARRILGFNPSRTLVQELVEIIESYIQMGKIDISLIKRPSVMLRALSGQIALWREGDTPMYGWSQEQVIGTISHSLLQTEFPEADLKAINEAVQRRGEWTGMLLHRKKSGEPIRVKSTWKLVKLPSHADPFILELNHPIEEPSQKNMVAFA